MACEHCHAQNQKEFLAEVFIHICDKSDLERPPVSVFPKLLVCLSCGFAEFTTPERELKLLNQSRSDRAFRGPLQLDA